MNFKKAIQVGVIASSAVLLLAACGGNKKTSGGASSDKQVANIMELSELPTLDSAKATDIVSGNALAQVMEGLYRLDKDGKAIPAVAKEEAKVSGDKLHYTFKLRKDAKWSNGEKVTAKDFVYGWQRAADPKTASQYGYLFADMKNGQDILDSKKAPKELGVKATDDYTLDVELERPVPYFDLLMAFQTFYPANEKFTAEKGDKYGTNSKNVLYNGPFVMKEWDGTGLKWQMAKNDKYYDKDKVKLDGLNFQVVKEPSTALDLYNGKKLDDVILSGEIAKQSKNNSDFNARKQASVFYLELNQKKVDAFKNKKVRQALSLVLDRKQLVNNILGDGSVTPKGLIPTDFAKGPDNKSFTEDDKGNYAKTNVKEAKKLWEEAKKELGVDKLDIELVTSDTETGKKTGEFIQGAIQDNLEGVKVNVTTVPLKVRVDRGNKGDFDLIVNGWMADFEDPISFLDLFTTGSSYNRGKWSNTEYDKYVKASKTTDATDPEKRWEDMLKAHKVIMDDQGIIPLYQSARAHLTNPNIKGALYHPAAIEYDYRNASISK